MTSIYLLVSDIFCQLFGNNQKLMGLCGPFGPRVEVFMSVDLYVNIVYIMPTIGRCMSVGVYIDIGYILPIIGGYV